MKKTKTHYIDGEPVAKETEFKMSEPENPIDVATPNLEKKKADIINDRIYNTDYGQCNWVEYFDEDSILLDGSFTIEQLKNIIKAIEG